MNTLIESAYQITRDVNTMLVYHWARVADSGTSLNQQWAKAYRLLSQKIDHLLFHRACN